MLGFFPPDTYITLLRVNPYIRRRFVRIVSPTTPAHSFIVLQKAIPTNGMVRRRVIVSGQFSGIAGIKEYNMALSNDFIPCSHLFIDFLPFPSIYASNFLILSIRVKYRKINRFLVNTARIRLMNVRCTKAFPFISI